MLEDLGTLSFVLAFLFVAIFESTRRLSRRRADKKHLSYPPGPLSLPVVGNALQISSTAPWSTYEKWGKTYGDIIYYRLFKQNVIVINSEKIARELLEKRSYNYSDRPALITTELFGMSSVVTPLMRYGDTWRHHRRFYHHSLRSAPALSYRPLQMRKAHELLINMLEAPGDFMHHTDIMAASVVMSITYGYEIDPHGDPLVSLVESLNATATKIFTPEASAILMSWPSLLYLPSWFPGLKFKRFVKGFREMLKEVADKPFQYTKNQMASNSAIPCMVSDLLTGMKDAHNYDELEKIMKCAAASSFSAGADTTATNLIVFILAMVLHPDVQERAQAEIDSVVGKDRLPDFEDRISLPYVEAVLRETHRWHPIVPLGLAHAALNDDIYDGFRIPGGAVVIANTWAMSRNEAKYSNPSEFMPERFLLADNKLNDDAVQYAFGFGRRVCPGKHVADASLWASIVSLLAVFKFSKAIDDQGREINIEPQWTYGASPRPIPFVCRIEPRSTALDSEKLHQMINQFT